MGFERREGWIETADGLRLPCVAVSPETPVATLLFVHGYGEHGAKYLPVAYRLAEKGIASFAFDYRGHGRAPGKRGYVRSFSDYLLDLEAALGAVEGAAPLFLLGHSLGGLIASRFALQEREGASRVAGMILTAPYLELALETPRWKVALGRVVGAVLPWLRVRSGITPELLSSDEAMRDAMREDPLAFWTTTPRWFDESRRAQREVMEGAEGWTHPLLLLVPEEDGVAAPDAMRSFFERIGGEGPERRLLSFADGLHELLFEREEIRGKAVEAIAEWVLARCGEEGRGRWGSSG